MRHGQDHHVSQSADWGMSFMWPVCRPDTGTSMACMPPAWHCTGPRQLTRRPSASDVGRRASPEGLSCRCTAGCTELDRRGDSEGTASGWRPTAKRPAYLPLVPEGIEDPAQTPAVLVGHL